MGVLLYLAAACLIGSALLPTLARWALATARPVVAVPLVTVGSWAVAFGLGISVSTLAISVIAGWPPIAELGGVSASRFHALDPMPNWLGIVAATAVVVCLLRSLLRLVLILTRLWQSTRLCLRLPGRSTVVFTDADDIVTLAGLRSRIVVGRALYDRLEPRERQVVLAHELSHLRRHHHWYVHAIEIAAAANPLLLPMRSLVRLGIERWADEDAAGEKGVADRRLAAEALAHAALWRQRIRAGRVALSLPGALAAAALQVSARVRALLEPAKPLRPGRVVLIATLSVAVLITGLYGLDHVTGLIEIAQLR